MFKRYDELPVQMKAAIWFVLCNVLNKGILFFTVPLFTRLLSPDEYGKLTLFASYEQLIVILATWEIGLSPFQRGLFKYSDDKTIWRSNTILFSMSLSVILGTILLFFSKLVTQFTEMPLWLLVTVMVYAATYTAYNSWMTESKVNYCYKKVSILTVALVISQTACSMVAVCFIKATASVKLFYSLLPAIVLNIIIMFRRFKISVLVSNKGKVKEQLLFLARFTWPLVIHSLSYLVLGQADRIMIGKMVSNSASGLYSVSYTIASIVIIVQSAVLQVLSPWVYQCMNNKKYGEIRTRMTPIIILVSALYIIFIALAPDLIIFMYPEYYWDGIWCIPPIAVGVYFMFMYSLFVMIEECMDETKYVAIVSVICAVLNIILNFIGIKSFGYIACAYTTLFCYVLFAIGHYFFMTKVVKRKIGKVKIYDTKTFLLMSLMVVVLMLGVTLIYESRLLRYLMVAIIAIIGFGLRNIIIEIIKTSKSG